MLDQLAHMYAVVHPRMGGLGEQPPFFTILCQPHSICGTFQEMNVLKLVFAYMFSIRTTNKKTLSDVLLTVQVSKLPFTFHVSNDCGVLDSTLI